LNDLEHALPDAAEIAQIEYVVEFGRGRQHLHLRHLPDDSRHRNEVVDELNDLLIEPLRTEVAAADDRKDLVDGAVGRQRAVKDGELALESLRDVVPTASRVDHRCQELDVDDVGELAGLLEAVEALDLHRLAGNLVGDLVAPLVDDRHVDVVDEHGHALAARRTVRRSDAFLHVALHDALKQHRCRGGREVEALRQLFLRVVLGHVAFDHHCLSRSLLAD